MEFTVRPAQRADREDVIAFTRATWPDREADYLPRVFDDWVDADGDRRRTLVADADGRAVGIVQFVLLSSDEAWAQGMRVDPEFRGHDAAGRLVRAGYRWAREAGATVARNMVFSWNAMGMGHARAVGFRPTIEFRFVHPEPDPDATPHDVTPDLDVVGDAVAGWRFWTESDARAHLAGLALDPGETWALSELTRETLREATAADRLFVVQGDGSGDRSGGTRGMAFRVREVERPTGGDGEASGDEGEDGDDGGEQADGGDPEPERWAEYGVGAWADAESCRALLRAVARDAAERGADRARVLVPETVDTVSDAAAARVPVADAPDFVLTADLTDPSLLDG